VTANSKSESFRAWEPRPPRSRDGAPGFLKTIAKIAFWAIIVNTIENAPRDSLTDALCSNIEGQSPADCKAKDTDGAETSIAQPA
jgi:hypothetical protein